MSKVIDISRDWLLGWVPERELNRWKQRFGDWRVENGALIGESLSSAQILADIDPESTYAWESTVCLENDRTSLSVIVCFLQERNTYYQILLTPGSPITVNYVMSDGFDGELMPPSGQVVETHVPYKVHVDVEENGVHVSVDDTRIGSFSDARLAGRMAGFMVSGGRAKIQDVTLRDAVSGELLFSDDFSSDSLRRTVVVELSELQPEEWIPAVVPGTVHTALLEAGKIDDPYYGCNGPKQKWIDKQRWIYKKSFTVPEDCSGSNLQLIFEGIDYHGYIWLNGQLLGYHEGMHLARTLDISDKVRRDGANELIVCLLPCPSPPHSNVKPYILQRWHYNMDILTIGLWRPVKLRAFDNITLSDPQVITRGLTEDRAVIDIGFTITSNTMYPFDLTGTVRIEGPDSREDVIEESFSTGYFTGGQRRNLRMTIPNPKLWWPNGMGEQPLYTLRIHALVIEPTKSAEPTGSDSLWLKFGVRTLEMRSTPNGNWKYDWMFTVNGRPFFAKGTNWMPIDQMLRLGTEHYERLLERARDAYINMLRPWGGGLVETDAFYDVCDRLGICVWQEFPLANGYFHEMDRGVWRDTIIQNVKRLRNRPSLFMWCGGNEFDPDCFQNKEVVDTLEDLCHELDPSRDFHRACPYGGDSHSYQVNWMEGANYTYFTRDLSAAVTEFSMASPPNMETLRRFIPEDEFASWPPQGPAQLEEFDLAGWNPSFRNRESAFSMHDEHFSRALKVMMPFVSDSGVPEDWEQFIEYAQTSQGILTQFGIDFWRSRWPYCTGTMSWAFNVTWPSSMTWEYIDWFGVPKASYYDQRRAYEPLHVGAVYDELFTAPGTELRTKLFVVNDTVDSYPGAVLQARLYDVALNQLTEYRAHVSLPALDTLRLGFFAWRVPKSARRQVLFLCVELLDRQDGSLLSRSVYTPRIGTPLMRMPYLKDGPWICDVHGTPTTLMVEWSERWHEADNGRAAEIRITNTGDKPAYRVRVTCPERDHELRYSDNYFWLESGEQRLIRLQIKENPPDKVYVAAWNTVQQDLAAD